MTYEEFDNYEFRAGEIFEVVNDWTFRGRTGRILEVDFRNKNIVLVIDDVKMEFRAEQVEPVSERRP